MSLPSMLTEVSCPTMSSRMQVPINSSSLSLRSASRTLIRLLIKSVCGRAQRSRINLEKYPARGADRLRRGERRADQRAQTGVVGRVLAEHGVVDRRDPLRRNEFADVLGDTRFPEYGSDVVVAAEDPRAVRPAGLTQPKRHGDPLDLPVGGIRIVRQRGRSGKEGRVHAEVSKGGEDCLAFRARQS